VNERAAIVDAVTGLLGGGEPGVHEGDAPDLASWRELAEAGFTLVGVDESLGGSGGDLSDAAAVVATVAELAVPLPVAECLWGAAAAFAVAGRKVPSGPITSSAYGTDDMVTLSRRGGGAYLDGRVRRVPWGATADVVCVLATDEDGEPSVAIVPKGAATVVRLGRNLADEPRDDIEFAATPVAADACWPVSPGTDAQLRLLATLARGVQMAAALPAVQRLVIRYVAQREQFGRPLAAFQAVQQLVAQVAGHVSLVQCAVENAIASWNTAAAPMAVAALKVQAGRSASQAARDAHHLVGALGMTREYGLHRLTRRLWSWRDECGSDSVWAARIGSAMTRTDADAWDVITQTAPLDLIGAGSGSRQGEL
jgi:acyl-CoA dehydrogenase